MTARLSARRKHDRVVTSNRSQLNRPPRVGLIHAEFDDICRPRCVVKLSVNHDRVRW